MLNIVADISILRVLGITCGLVSLTVLFYRLRSHSRNRFGDWLLACFGFALISIGLFPGLLNLPADMINLRDKPGGRIITLLILSSILLWIFLINERFKRESRESQFDLLLRSLVLKEFSENVQETTPPESILILIPAFNEAENLAAVLPSIPKTLGDTSVKALVINDGSTDDTESVARLNGALVISHPFNRGGGAALRIGYDVASTIEASIVVTMDGDGQHLPSEIAALVTPILKDEADIVIGSRVIGSREKDSTIRWVGLHIFNWLVNILTGLKISDCSSGFRAFRLTKLQKVKLLQDQFHTAELIIDAAKKGFRIKEVPITILKRKSGQSKKGKNFKYGLNFAKAIVKTWWR
jgi:cellulose synthase/poly-beta-1,6-N-acetylglucosamine synthase-like glycosyltransferase